MKIDEAIVHFEEYLRVIRRYSPATLSTYDTVLVDFAKFMAHNGITTIEAVDSLMIREWQIQHAEQGEAATTINKRISTLRSLFKYLRREGVVKNDVMAKVTTPKKPQSLPIFFREKEVEHLYNDGLFPDDFEGERDKLLLRVLYETGIRRSEAIGLTESSIDLNSKNLKVLGKRNKERVIPIENELVEAIRRYLLMRETIADRDEALFISANGKAISCSKLYTIVKKYMGSLSNAERISPHVFRHTFATHMLNQGANIDAIKELLGHSSLNATEIYTHVTREQLKDVYRHAHPRSTKKKDTLRNP